MKSQPTEGPLKAEVLNPSGYWYYYHNGKKGPIPVEKIEALYRKTALLTTILLYGLIKRKQKTSWQSLPLRTAPCTRFK